MSKEEPSYDTNEYDEESFDKDSSEDVSSDEESVSEEESIEEQSLEELLPYHSSAKTKPDSNENPNQIFDQNDPDEMSSVYSEEDEDEETPQPILKTGFDEADYDINSEDDKETPSKNEYNKTENYVKSEEDGQTPPHHLISSTKYINETNQGVPSSSDESEETPDSSLHKEASELKNYTKAEIHTKTSPHEIEESESDDLAEEELTDNFKSLNIQNEQQRSSPKVVVPTENTNLETPANIDDGPQDASCQQSEIEFFCTSQTPTSFNSENCAFHVEVTQKPTRSNTSMQQQRNSHRKSLSFSNERMREIERHNQILLRKILTQKPRKEFVNQKNQCPQYRMTTSAVNRKKQQRQIDLDNQVLKRKIEAIALRRPKILE